MIYNSIVPNTKQKGDVKMIQKIVPIVASITLIGSASLTAYADMVLSISLDTFYSNKNYATRKI